MSILSRAYKGYTVAGKPFTKFKNKPDCYELSFVCPRGLSGAPLLSLGSDFILGVIIGNEQSEMEVHRSTEQITDDKTNVYITSEILTHGIALQSKEIMNIKSDLLGATIGEYLQSNNLIK